jgi:hypothetical protein
MILNNHLSPYIPIISYLGNNQPIHFQDHHFPHNSYPGAGTDILQDSHMEMETNTLPFIFLDDDPLHDDSIT